MGSLFEPLGRALAAHLSRRSKRYLPLATTNPEQLRDALRPGDVLLVEGNTKIAMAIKYLTQSTWSHAALFVGAAFPFTADGDVPVLIEADLLEGVRAVPLRHYEDCHTRICRPVGLSPQDLESVIRGAIVRIGQKYDLRNIIDLARYLLPTPPVPQRWRRRMIALGSGDPTRAICSTLIAQLFQSVGYPILPHVERRPAPRPDCNDCYDEILHIRHHSLFAPRDFDISPYFRIVKPALDADFDYHEVSWSREARGIVREEARP
jgi:hypothetical protein